jgi:hypothetical protein
MPTFAVSGTSFLEKGATFGSLPTTGGTLTGPLTIGAAPGNALTITPGATTANPIVISATGSMVEFTKNLRVGDLTTTTSLTILPGGGPGEEATITAGSGEGGLDLIVSTTAIGYPGVNNRLRITPGAAAANTIEFAQSGTGGMTFLGQVNIGPVGTSSPIALTAGSSFSSPATIGVVGAGLRFTCNVGFNNFPPPAKPTVAGSRGGNAALASLLTALASYGLVTDSSTA